MTSPRLKPYGWIDFVEKDFSKGPRYSSMEEDLIAVPPFCFDILAFDVSNSNALSQWIPFSPHKLEVCFLTVAFL